LGLKGKISLSSFRNSVPQVTGQCELPQGQMKINKDTINFFKSLYWDYQVSEENIITIIELGECNGLTRKNLLSRALKSRRWYEIKKILSPELLKEALSEDVLKTLFPKSLCLKYNYVRKLLYQ
jgi:hypothetical protein